MFEKEEWRENKKIENNIIFTLGLRETTIQEKIYFSNQKSSGYVRARERRSHPRSYKRTLEFRMCP